MALYAHFSSDQLAVHAVQLIVLDGPRRLRYQVVRTDGRSRSHGAASWFDEHDLNQTERDYLRFLATERGLIHEYIPRYFPNEQESDVAQSIALMRERYDPPEPKKTVQKKKKKMKKRITKTKTRPAKGCESFPIPDGRIGDQEGLHASIGDVLIAMDHKGYSGQAKIVNAKCDMSGTRHLCVHWIGFKARHDEWIQVGMGRLRDFPSTTPTTSTTHTSPPRETPPPNPVEATEEEEEATSATKTTHVWHLWDLNESDSDDLDEYIVSASAVPPMASAAADSTCEAAGKEEEEEDDVDDDVEDYE